MTCFRESIGANKGPGRRGTENPEVGEVHRHRTRRIPSWSIGTPPTGTGRGSCGPASKDPVLEHLDTTDRYHERELRTGIGFLLEGEKMRAGTEYQHPGRGAVGNSEPEHVRNGDRAARRRKERPIQSREREAMSRDALRFGGCGAEATPVI